MIKRSQLIDKRDIQKRFEGRKGNMKNRYTYKLVIQSEDRNRNIVEIALYALVALSSLVSIWQFAEQRNMLPLQSIGIIEQRSVVAISLVK